MDKETKETFFNELYQLDDSQSEEDYCDAVEKIRKSRSITVRCSHADQPLERTVSAPLPLVSTPSKDGVDNSLKAPTSSVLSHTAKREVFSGTSRQKKQTRDVTVLKDVNGKRKRGHSVSLMPESQQIFKNSFFCTYMERDAFILELTVIVFFPNNDIAPSRGFRIRKAMEWGATWIKEWRSSITHVIVDKELCYKDLLNFLKIDALPVSDQKLDASRP